MHYHVIVTGSRPEKGSDGKFLPVPEANAMFITEVLSKVNPKDMTLYHGAAAGVDTVADDFAFSNGVRVKQFPAYWWNPRIVKEKPHIDKGAGFFRNETMVREAISNAHNKDDHAVVLLAFHNTEDIADSHGTNQCYEFAKGKGVTVRSYKLPVLKGTTPTTTAPTRSDAVPF